MAGGVSVSVEVTHVSLGRLSGKTGLDVLDFERGHGIVVVEGRLINEALVEHSLEEELEVAHESGMVSHLVLGEHRHEAVVLLGAHGIDLGELGEPGHETEETEGGHSVEETKVASLKEKRQKLETIAVMGGRGEVDPRQARQLTPEYVFDMRFIMPVE